MGIPVCVVTDGIPNFQGFGPKVAGKGPASWPLPLEVFLKQHPATNVSGHPVCLRASLEGGGGEIRGRVLKTLLAGRGTGHAVSR